VRAVSLRTAGRVSNLKMTAVGDRTTVAPMFTEVCEQTGVTLSRYMMEVARQNPELRDLESLMGGIQQACKTIANLVDRATITGMVSRSCAKRAIFLLELALLNARRAAGRL
jgi:hypothetical protein